MSRDDGDEEISLRVIDGAYFLRIGDCAHKLSKAQMRVLSGKVMDIYQVQIFARNPLIKKPDDPSKG